MVGLWFSPGTPVSSTKKTDRKNITEILLTVALQYMYCMILMMTAFVRLLHLYFVLSVTAGRNKWLQYMQQSNMMTHQK